jgi:GT2 family glycosyltransferase
MTSANGTRTGVVVPATACVCAQAEQIASELGPSDRMIIVWNGPRSAATCKAHLGLDACQWVELPTRVGAAGARNRGASFLWPDVDLLVFADSDDRVTCGWLAALTRSLRSGENDLAGGALRIVTKRESSTVAPGADYWHHQALFGGNLAVIAAAWSRLGGFDEGLSCCEDTDFAWRASDAGLRVGVAADAIVEVNHITGVSELLQRVRWGWWSIRLLDKHSLSARHIPSIRTLIRDKRASRYCSHPLVAAFGQWLGQWYGRMAIRRWAGPLAGSRERRTL